MTVEIIIRPKGRYTRCTAVLGTVEEIKDMLIEIFKLDQHDVNLSEHQLIELAIKKWNSLMYVTGYITIVKLKYSTITKRIRLHTYIREDYLDLKYLFGITVPSTLDEREISPNITLQFKTLAAFTGDDAFGIMSWGVRQICRNSDFYIIMGMIIFLVATGYMHLK